MRHSVAFECANDAKKNYPNIYFHMEPGENRPEVESNGFAPWIYAMDLDFHRVPCKNIYSDIFLCIIIAHLKATE